MLEAMLKVKCVSASLLYQLQSGFLRLLVADREICNVIDDVGYQFGVQFCQILVAGYPLLHNLSPPVFLLKRNIGSISDSNFGTDQRYSVSYFGRINKLELLIFMLRIIWLCDKSFMADHRASS
jgi:hypothetical protein